MALVTTGFWLNVELIDNGGNRTSKTYQMRETVHADVLTDAAAAVAALAAISNAEVVGYGIREQFVEDALALPASGIQIEDQAILDIPIDDNPLKTATLSIPAPVIGIFTGTSGVLADTVDVADSALLTFVNLFKAAGTLYISDGEDADATTPISSGRRVHRRSNRRRAVRMG